MLGFDLLGLLGDLAVVGLAAGLLFDRSLRLALTIAGGDVHAAEEFALQTRRVISHAGVLPESDRQHPWASDLALRPPHGGFVGEPERPDALDELLHCDL